MVYFQANRSDAQPAYGATLWRWSSREYGMVLVPPRPPRQSAIGTYTWPPRRPSPAGSAVSGHPVAADLVGIDDGAVVGLMVVELAHRVRSGCRGRRFPVARGG